MEIIIIFQRNVWNLALNGPIEVPKALAKGEVKWITSHFTKMSANAEKGEKCRFLP